MSAKYCLPVPVFQFFSKTNPPCSAVCLRIFHAYVNTLDVLDLMTFYLQSQIKYTFPTHVEYSQLMELFGCFDKPTGALPY